MPIALRGLITRGIGWPADGTVGLFARGILGGSAAPVPDVAFFTPRRAPKVNPEFRARQEATLRQIAEWRRRSMQKTPPAEPHASAPSAERRVAWIAALAEMADDD